MQFRGGVGDAITYLLRDEFTTNEAAPMVSPRTCDPGPGTIPIVDTSNRFAIVSGDLVGSAAAAVAYASSTSSFAHAGGRAAIFEGAKYTVIGQQFGWSASANPAAGNIRGSFEQGFIRGITGGGVAVPSALDTTARTLVIVRRAGGGSWLIRDGELVWIDVTVSTAALFVTDYLAVTSGAGLVSAIKVLDFGAPWATDYGIASARTAITAANDTIAAGAGDTWIEHTITAATGITQELLVRRTDDSNCIIVRMDQTAGTIRIYEKNAGVETEKTGGTTTQTWTNATAFRVSVRLSGTGIRVWVGTTAKNVATSTFNQSATGVKVSHAGTDLIAWPFSVTSLLPAF
jgi:hypothetical protein